jgi:hypothetical protein
MCLVNKLLQYNTIQLGTHYKRQPDVRLRISSIKHLQLMGIKFCLKNSFATIYCMIQLTLGFGDMCPYCKAILDEKLL